MPLITFGDPTDGDRAEEETTGTLCHRSPDKLRARCPPTSQVKVLEALVLDIPRIKRLSSRLTLLRRDL